MEHNNHKKIILKNKLSEEDTTNLIGLLDNFYSNYIQIEYNESLAVKIKDSDITGGVIKRNRNSYKATTDFIISDTKITNTQVYNAILDVINCKGCDFHKCETTDDTIIQRTNSWHDGKFYGVEFSGTWYSGNWHGYQFNGEYKGTDEDDFRAFKNITPIGDNDIVGINSIKDSSLYELTFQLMKRGFIKSEFIDIKKFQKIRKADSVIDNLSQKPMFKLFLQKYSNGFKLTDVAQYDKEYSVKIDNFCDNKYVEIKHFKWNGSQVLFEDPNYVFQINLKPTAYDSILTTLSADDLISLKELQTKSVHPNSKDSITLGWVRYTITKDDENMFDFELNSCVIDELQSDLKKKLPSIAEYANDWETFCLGLFIKYARTVLKVRKFYMPTKDGKDKFYETDVPVYLYKDIPKKFGFKPTPLTNKFMVLETNLISFSDFINS